MTSSGGTSRAGRVSIPGWQKRQPRVQPRRISMVSRSCTVDTYGTRPICCDGSGVATRRCTRAGTPSASSTGNTAPPQPAGASYRLGTYTPRTALASATSVPRRERRAAADAARLAPISGKHSSPSPRAK
jgi:hypothetical protein